MKKSYDSSITLYFKKNSKLYADSPLCENVILKHINAVAFFLKIMVS